MKNLFFLIAVFVFVNGSLFAQGKNFDGAEFQFITGEGVRNFIEKANDYGKMGYKLEKVTRIPSYFNENLDQIKFAAVIRLDSGNKYVYDWTSSIGSVDFVSDRNNGFKPVEIIPFSQNCKPTNGRFNETQTETTAGYIIDSLKTENGNIFLLEQKNGSNQKSNFHIIDAAFGFGKEPSKEISSEVSAATKTGFNPSRFFFSKNTGLTQTISILYEENAAASPNAEYIFVRKNLGFKKKVNSLAKQGYVLVASGEMQALNIALMRKDDNSSAPVSYEWLNASDKKTFAKDLTKIPQNGARYRSINWEAYGCEIGFIENRLIFENNPANSKNTYEYKTLKMTEDMFKRRGEKSVPSAMIPTEVTAQNFNKMLSEGFVIRDLFYEDGVNVLFERLQK